MRVFLIGFIVLSALLPAAADAAPKNGRIVFGNINELLSLRSDGSDARVLTDKWEHQEVSGSPDGARLVTTANEAIVFVSAADGSEVGRIERPGEFFLGSAEWSPRGSELAYQECDKSEFTDIDECVTWGIYRVPVAGGARKRVAEGVDPNWSADGRWLTFLHKVRPHDKNGNECYGIYVARRDGSKLRRVYPRAKRCVGSLEIGFARPFFGPRRRSILFGAGDGLWRVRLDGTHKRRVLRASRGRNVFLSRLSPDQKRIAYTADGGVWVTSASRGGRGKRVADARYPNALAWLAR
jgi:dipeptidyl aminopeptidase/acylaminoacyl peptidase